MQFRIICTSPIKSYMPQRPSSFHRSSRVASIISCQLLKWLGFHQAEKLSRRRKQERSFASISSHQSIFDLVCLEKVHAFTSSCGKSYEVEQNHLDTSWSDQPIFVSSQYICAQAFLVCYQPQRSNSLPQHSTTYSVASSDQLASANADLQYLYPRHSLAPVNWKSFPNIAKKSPLSLFLI